MELRDIQAQQQEFLQERDWKQFHTIENLCKAVSVEAAELLEIALWRTEILTTKISSDEREHIEEEVADILLYVLSLCNVAEIDPLQAMSSKIAKNRVKYPVELYKGRFKLT